MKRRVFLHIGMHKTATTWLQQNLFPMIDKRIIYNDPNSYKTLTDIFRYGCARDDITTAIEHFKTITENQFFSAEIMCGNLFAGYPEFKQHLDIIEKVFNGWDINIIFVVRQPSKWLLSCYKESIFEHHYMSYDEFLSGHPWVTATGKYYSVHSMIDELMSRTNIRVNFMTYENFSDNPDLFISDFCNIMEISIPKYQSRRPNNVGYCVNTIIAINKLMSTLKSLHLNFMIPAKIEFFGPNSIYLLERRLYSTYFEKMVIRKLFWPIRRGNIVRLIFRTLDRGILARLPQRGLDHNFSKKTAALDQIFKEYLKGIKH